MQESNKVITTVLGDIAPGVAGFTTMHEHTMLDATPGIRRVKAQMGLDLPEERFICKPENQRFILDGNVLFSEDAYLYEDVPGMVKELEGFKAVGGQTLVDASGIGLRGNVSLMAEASRESGINIVCSTGAYYAVSWPDSILTLDEDALAELFLKEIDEGIDGTNVKPGMVKAAFASNSDMGPAYEREVEAFRAAARVAAATGYSLQVHTTGGMPFFNDVMGLLDIALDECGLAPDKLVMLHMTMWMFDGLEVNDYIRNFDAPRPLDARVPLALLERGVNVGLEGWALPTDYPTLITQNAQDSMKLLCKLLDAGYQDHITLGNDCICPKLMGLGAGWYGYTKWATYVVPKLLELGYGQEVVDALTTGNPARILAHPLR